MADMTNKVNDTENKNKEFFAQNKEIVQRKADYKQKYRKYVIEALVAYLWPGLLGVIGFNTHKAPNIVVFLIAIVWVIGVYFHKKRWTEDGAYAGFILKEKIGWSSKKKDEM